jgi:hypothetical protein
VSACVSMNPSEQARNLLPERKRSLLAVYWTPRSGSTMSAQYGHTTLCLSTAILMLSNNTAMRSGSDTRI